MAGSAWISSYRPIAHIFPVFFAGFITTLTFHQLALEALYAARIT